MAHLPPGPVIRRVYGRYVWEKQQNKLYGGFKTTGSLAALKLGQNRMGRVKDRKPLMNFELSNS